MILARQLPLILQINFRVFEFKQREGFGQVVMREKFLSSLSVFILLATAGLGSVLAQTTEETPAPSDQPTAPMEMGQPAPPQQPTPPPPGRMPPNQPQAGQPSQNMPEAQPGGPSGEGPAEVKQGVGHISFMKGDVSTQRGDSGTSSAAILNQPVLIGDKVSTGPNARAEVQLDYANILRLGPNAQANIANFTNNYIQIQLAQGIADYAVFNESEAEPEIDTPNVSVHPAHQDVVVRVEVRSDGDSVVIVRKGEVQISTPKGIADVKEGQMATVRGQVQDAQYKIASAPERDDWDIWNSERDHMIHSAKAWQHTSPYYTGAEDLDANGNWENVPDYGQIWVPNEPDGWTPYRDGNWVWEPYYGWTWVGYEPWGWAPYHYGRWMWYGGAWGWWPGPVWVRASIVHSGRRLMFLSLDSEVLDSALVSVLGGADSAGCRSDPVIGSIPGGADMAVVSATSVLLDSVNTAASVESLHCMQGLGSQMWRILTTRTLAEHSPPCTRASSELAG